jgi:transglutaminase-like putative cysteine protease
MARPQGTSPRAQRLTSLLAVCAIAVATAFAFGRVFAGHGSTWRFMGVALASALVAGALERRNLLIATLVSAAVLAVVIGLFVFPGTTWHGLPTLDTLRHAFDASHLVGEQARLQVAPSPPLKPLMLASIVAMWAAIFSCHALAFRAGSPLLALLPPIALLAFADTVLEEFIKPLYGIVFLAAALAIVFADALRRVQGWGPVWTGAGSRARLSATASRGARRVAVAAVGTAMIVPFLVPGFGSKAIFDISSTNDSDRVRIDPLVSIKASLTRKDPVEVFQVQADAPSYWRMLSLPTFDGDTWRPDLTDLGGALTPDTILSSGTAGTEPIHQTFTISSDLGFRWLPVAYPPQQIDVPDTTVRYNSSNGTATLDGELDAGAEYQATSVRVQPTPEQLAALTFPPAAQNNPSTSLGDVPPDVVAGIRAIAEQWTEGAANDYERVLAIQDHLNDDTEFTYDKSVPARDDSYTLLEFLTSTKRGFCQQFASAMAVMLRTLGFPARLAEGFTPGHRDPDTGVYHVTTSEYHAWVEVLFPTYGWLAFEPTPGRTNPVANEYQHPSVSCPPGTPGCPTVGGGGGIEVPGATGAQGRLPRQLENLARREFAGGLPLSALPPLEAAGDRGKRVPAGLVILLLLALSLGVALAIPPFRALRRRVRLRKAGPEPRAMILATFDVFAERAADLGHPKAPGETLEEYRRRIAEGGLITDGHLDRLTSIAGRAAYAPAEPAGSDVREASEAASSVLHDLRERTPIGRRIAGQYRLRR